MTTTAAATTAVRVRYRQLEDRERATLQEWTVVDGVVCCDHCPALFLDDPAILDAHTQLVQAAASNVSPVRYAELRIAEALGYAQLRTLLRSF